MCLLLLDQVNLEEFFIMDKSLYAMQRLKGAVSSNTDAVKTVRKIMMAVKPRHPLSVTFSKGNAVIYFEPFVTGGEKFEDVEALYLIAKKMKAELANS